MLYLFEVEGKYSSPYFFKIKFLAPFIPSSERDVESVLIYVIKPFSYNCCASRIVFLADDLNFLAASCCKVEVVNGGFGWELTIFSSIFVTVQLPLSSSLISVLACDSDKRITSSLFNLPVFGSKSFPTAIRLLSILLNKALNSVLPLLNEAIMS